MVKESWPSSGGGTNREIVPKDRVVYRPEVVSPLEGLTLAQKRQMKAALEVFRLLEKEGGGIDNNTPIQHTVTIIEILGPVSKLLGKIDSPVTLGDVIRALENDQEIIDNRGY